MAWLLDAFAADAMQRALLAGMLAVVASSVVGTWVLLRGLSLLGDALAHGVIPGVALAVIWGFDLTLGALASAAVMVGGIWLVNRRTQLGDDTGIGLLFVGMLALGLVIISTSDSFTADVEELLVGDVLAVTWGDIGFQLGAVALVLAVTAFGYRGFVALSFNEAKAATLGLRPAVMHLALLGLIAVAVVASFKTVGTLLVSGLLIGPPATALLVVRRVWMTMLVAVLLGWVAVVVGLVLSYHAETAAGATIAGTSVVIFFLVLLAQELTAVLSRKAPAPA